jgi:hypothetical protein
LNLTTTLTLVIVLVPLIWFEAYCLADLARTGDEELRHLPRMAWAILCLSPFGAVLYLLYGKDR